MNNNEFENNEQVKIADEKHSEGPLSRMLEEVLNAPLPAAKPSSAEKHSESGCLPQLVLDNGNGDARPRVAGGPHTGGLTPIENGNSSPLAHPRPEVLPQEKVDRGNQPPDHTRDIRDILSRMYELPSDRGQMVKDLGEALTSGDIKGLQKLLEGVKTPEQMKLLKESVDVLNKILENCSDDQKDKAWRQFSKVEVGTNEKGEPYLKIQSTAMQGHLSDKVDLKISKDGASGYHQLGGFNRPEFGPMEGKDALKAIQKAFKSIGLEKALPEGDNRHKHFIDESPRPIVCTENNQRSFAPKQESDYKSEYRNRPLPDTSKYEGASQGTRDKDAMKELQVKPGEKANKLDWEIPIIRY